MSEKVALLYSAACVCIITLFSQANSNFLSSEITLLCIQILEAIKAKFYLNLKMNFKHHNGYKATHNYYGVGVGIRLKNENTAV